MKDMPDANRVPQETPNDSPAEAKQTEPAAKDGIDRRNFLSCMAWAGTGLVWTMMGGVPTSKLFAATARAAGGNAGHAHAGSEFSFVQISDSHIGFNKAANQDVAGTLKLAIDKINGLSATPELLLHTGDITQSSKPGEFDTAQQIIKGAKAGQTFYVPGEHDRQPTMVRFIGSGTAKAPSGVAITVLITKGCTLSG